jgi:hypothetical protein
MKFLICMAFLAALFPAISCRTVQAKSQQVLTDDHQSYSGTVKSRKVFPGTLSEYTVFFLETGDGGRFILFNLSNVSMGFESYSGREVRVSGDPGNGYIGWKRTLTNGIQVTDILIDTNVLVIPVR